MLKKQKIKLDLHTAAYLEHGQGIPLIFLHGFLGEGSAWLPIVQHLPRKFRCIALDLLGFGESSTPSLKYTIWHQVDFLQQFITAMQLDRFFLVGHSYGGWTAAAYAISSLGWSTKFEFANSNPEIQNSNLQGLTLIAPAGIRDDSFVGRYNYLKPLLWENALVDITLGAIAPVATLLGKEQQFRTIYQARQALRQQPVAKSFLYDRLRPEDAIDTVEKYIDQITAPTLVIAGGKDDTIPLWHCQTYADKIPQAEMVIFPTADHALIQTHSREIAERIQGKYK
jgi:pimeloyl-ACP methyl ester carboxylesterase